MPHQGANLKAVDVRVPDREIPPKPATHVVDMSIGTYIRRARGLSDAQVDDIVAHQRRHGVRFGEAAVALKLASSEDVLWALSQQFHYPYAADEGGSFNAELVAAVDPFGIQAESIREVRSQLMFDAMSPEQPRRPLAVLSSESGDGRSFFAANLAICFSQLGGRTLLVDADMRAPRQHELFKVPNDKGLSGLLAGRIEEGAIHSVPHLPSLFVLPVGTLPPNPVELLQRSAFGGLLRELLTKFDHVVMDTPALASGADARVIANRCGLSLIVARRGTTRMKPVERLATTLARPPGVFAGVVINDR
jgi:chain length determinant protein tyrosine kinase EpsG